MTTRRDDKTGFSDPAATASEREDRGAALLLQGLAALAREEDAALRAFAEPIPALPDAARDRLAARILAAQRGTAPVGDRPSLANPTGPPLSVLSGGRVADAEVRSGRRTTVFGRGPVPTTRRRALFVASVTGLLATAAAFAVWLRIDHRGPALPEYALAVTGGVQELRGGPADKTAALAAAPIRVRPDSSLVVTLRPAVSVQGSVAVRAFFIATANPARDRGTTSPRAPAELNPRVRVAASGAAELRLLGRELAEAGDVQGSLRILVGRPAAVSRAAPNDVAPDQDVARWFDIPVHVEAGE